MEQNNPRAQAQLVYTKLKCAPKENVLCVHPAAIFGDEAMTGPRLKISLLLLRSRR
ncbi:MAG: hypothetical protein IPK82_04375 [Polyangiaceae bacterium]|nr:hypothetical protein [Polyangiaceae bacterium]